MTLQTDLQAAIAKATAAAQKLHDVVHGDPAATIETDNGPVKTVAKTIADNEAAIAASRAELDQKVAEAAGSAAAAAGDADRAELAASSLQLPLPVGSGGTGADTSAGARTNLGLGALATKSAVAAGDLVDGAVTAPKLAAGVLPAGLAERLAFLEQNLALNTLRDQIAFGWSVLQMVDGVADEFQDQTGIDAGGSTGQSYDAAGDFYSNFGGYADATPVMTSNTAPSGEVIVTNGYGGPGDGYVLFDKDAGTAKSFNGASFEIRYDFPSATTLRKYAVTGAGAGYTDRSPKNWTFEGSNDGVDWTVLDTRIDQTGWAGSETRDYIPASYGSYLKYRLKVTANNGNGSYSELREVAFYERNPALNMDLVSVAQAADAVPLEARAILLHEPVEAAVPNADCSLSVSRDDGVTWTPASLLGEGAFDAATNVLSAIVDLTAQPNGTAMRWKFQTFNSKEQRLHGVWLQWR
ncbi:discoidin domain-containing protein [Albidovulum sp.]